MASVSRSIPTSRTTSLKNIIVSSSRELAMNPVATARVDLCSCSCVASLVLLLAGLLLFSSATIRASNAVNLAFPSLFVFVGWAWSIFAITSWDCFVMSSAIAATHRYDPPVPSAWEASLLPAWTYAATAPRLPHLDQPQFVCCRAARFTESSTGAFH